MVASALFVATLIGLVSMMPTFFTVVAAASTTVLIMGGTGHPLSSPPDSVQYVQEFTSAATDNFVSAASTMTRPTGIPQGPYNSVAVITAENGQSTAAQSIAEGLAALDSCITSSTCAYNESIGSTAPSPSDTIVVYGYSQSANIAMLEKAKLAAAYAHGEGPDVSFVVVGYGRPNGGLVARDTTGLLTYLVLGITRDQVNTDPPPTNTQYSTVDVAIQYDGLADFPLNPLNVLADLNAYAGMGLLHPNYQDHSLSEPGIVDQGQQGDTAYYLIPTPVLPLLMPLQQVPLIGATLADTLDPALRVLVEAGYDRTTSPGVATPFNVFYGPDPITVVTDFASAIPVGLDNGLQDVFGTRPFGTQRPGPYGVGGQDVDYVTPPSTAAAGNSVATTSPTTTTPSTAASALRRPASATSSKRSPKSTAGAADAAGSSQSKPGVHRRSSAKKAS